MRILFLSRWFPFPPNNGSKLRIYNLLRGLAEEHEITLFSFSDEPIPDLSSSEANSFCHEVRVFPWKSFTPTSLRALFGYFDAAPRSVRDTFSPEFAKAIHQTIVNHDYDLVIASQIDTAAYSPFFNELPALFEEVEIGVLFESFAYAKSNAQRIRSGLTWLKHKHYLERLLRDFKACTVVSEQEKKLLLKNLAFHNHVNVLPNCVYLSDYRCISENSLPDTLIFTGSFQFPPNYEGMVWFVRDVYPIIQAEIPEVGLVITGDHANRMLPKAANVTQTGFVEDIRPLIARSKISIAPIFQGGGTRLKILESMALRTPVVATTKGAEGLDIEDGMNIMIADTPYAFAKAVIRLLREPGLNETLSQNGFTLVSENYDWEMVLPKFLDLIEQIAPSHNRSRDFSL